VIRPSPELLAVSRRWFKALITRKDSELRNFLSESDHLQFIGSAEGETWTGPAVRQAVGAHFKEVAPVVKREELWASAFETDEVGWAFSAHRFWFENRTDPLTFHTTLVFILEEGSWKIIHRHASLPTPNLETFGHEHAAIQALMDAAQEGFALGQRQGLASVMFTDIVNSTHLAEVMGDRLWSAEITRHFGILRRIIEEAGGEFVKSLGDGTMSSFPSPQQALRAAQEILKSSTQPDGPKISLRVNIHSGDVVQTDEDFFGSVVNKAARIASAARSGEIRVSEVTRDMVGDSGGFTFSDPATIPLRGLDGTHLVHRLDW
jgi:class 3 adenylate cyclase